MLKIYSAQLETTSFCSKIIFNEQKPPNGCAILTVSGQCEIHLMLKGLIEIDKELQKLQKKKDNLISTVSKLQQLISSIDYSTKVPIDVQENNSEKLNESQCEIDRIQLAMDTLKLL